MVMGALLVLGLFTLLVRQITEMHFQVYYDLVHIPQQSPQKCLEK